MDKIIDFGYVFSAPTDTGIYGWTFFAVTTVGMIVANFFYFYGKYRFKNNLLTYTLINRASRNAAIVFTLGFVFFLCRFAKLQPFNARLFLDITVIALIYFIVRGVGYMSRTYPKAKAEWQARQGRDFKKTEARPATTAVPSVAGIKGVTKVGKPVTSGTLATSSADAGGEETVESLPAASQVEVPLMRQGLSERGQKRRERKRSRR